MTTRDPADDHLLDLARAKACNNVLIMRILSRDQEEINKDPRKRVELENLVENIR